MQNLVNPTTGSIRGTPFPCPIVAGTRTGAQVTDCSGMGPERTETATGWSYVGHFNHPGRDCSPKPADARNCNNNIHVNADEGVAIAHEADPSHNAATCS